MNMAKALKALKALKLIGAANALRAVRYALWRDRLDRPFRPLWAQEKGSLPPGQCLAADPLPSGYRFRYHQAQLEVIFLAPDLVRLSWSPGVSPIPYAIARQEWPPVAISPAEKPAGWHLQSQEMALLVGRDGSVRLYDARGALLREELPPKRCGEGWLQQARLFPEEHLYGLGERAAPFNLRGRTYRQWNRDAGGSYTPGDDPLYLCIPVYMGIHLQGSYLVFYENSFDALFSLGDAGAPDLAVAHFAGGALRYYLIPGPPARALERYTELTGRPPLPPRWALGYHQSRFSYRDEADVRNVFQKFQEHDLPLSAIHLDLDYMDGLKIFTVNRQRFPHMKAMAQEFAAHGVYLVPIVDAGIKRDPSYEVYRRGLEAGAFCALPDGQPVAAPVWPGWCAFADFTNPKARGWWGTLYPLLLEYGMSGFWHDMNEPSAFAAWGDLTLPLPTRHSLEGRGGDHREAHNLYGLLMNRAGYEALRQLVPDRRPFLLTRSGWAGVQRYAWTWTGDTESSWANLRQTVATALGLGLSGIPYTGPDIGGFSGYPSAELYIRWFQLAAFLPFFRGHAALGYPRREPWVFGEPALSICREFLRLRYRLLPYLYTLAWHASQTGHPLVRPLFWDVAQTGPQHLLDVADAFLLGDALLVAPIVEEGATSRQVPLPPGKWYDFWDDAAYVGPDRVLIAAPLERLPLLVRAGSVLPTEEQGRLTLHIYAPSPGEQGQGMLYTDAGDGYGDWRLDRFRPRWEAEDLEVEWEQEGTYPFPWAEVEIQMHGFMGRHALVDGKEVPVHKGGRIVAKPFYIAKLSL